MGFVSDRHMDAVAQAAAAEARATAAEEETTRLRQHNDMLMQEIKELTATIVQMRREGFNPTMPINMEPQPQEEPLDPEIMRACSSLAEPGSRLYEELVEDARRMRDHEQLDTRAIVQATLRGGTQSMEEAWITREQD